MPTGRRPRLHAACAALLAAALLLPPPAPACPLDILLFVPPEKLVQIVIVRAASVPARLEATHAR